MAFHTENGKREKGGRELKYFETFDALRESVLAAFGKYMSNAAEVIRGMKKLRSSAELQLLVDSFSIIHSRASSLIVILSLEDR